MHAAWHIYSSFTSRIVRRRVFTSASRRWKINLSHHLLLIRQSKWERKIGMLSLLCRISKLGGVTDISKLWQKSRSQVSWVYCKRSETTFIAEKRGVCAKIKKVFIWQTTNSWENRQRNGFRHYFPASVTRTRQLSSQRKSKKKLEAYRILNARLTPRSLEILMFCAILST